MADLRLRDKSGGISAPVQGGALMSALPFTAMLSPWPVTRSTPQRSVYG
jgi:hypothetical protein